MKRNTLIQVLLSTSVLVCALPGAALGHPAPVARTGQTRCYDGANNLISCDIPRGNPLYGQDGQLQKGVAWPQPRFVTLVNKADDTGVGGGVASNRICDGAERCNGAVKDRLTNLTWLENSDCLGPVDWVTALKHASEMADGQCGLRDGSQPGEWRLPNVKELQSLINFQCSLPALPDRKGTGCFGYDSRPPFSNIHRNYYYYARWSSTACLYYGFSSALRVNTMAAGGTRCDSLRVNNSAVWPVRSSR